MRVGLRGAGRPHPQVRPARMGEEESQMGTGFVMSASYEQQQHQHQQQRDDLRRKGKEAALLISSQVDAAIESARLDAIRMLRLSDQRVAAASDQSNGGRQMGQTQAQAAQGWPLEGGHQQAGSPGRES